MDTRITLVWDRPGQVYGKDIRLTMMDDTGAIMWCRLPTEAERIAIAAGHIPHMDDTTHAQQAT